jgi:hypothetical protein
MLTDNGGGAQVFFVFWNQGDRIGRIFACWVIVYFG